MRMTGRSARVASAMLLVGLVASPAQAFELVLEEDAAVVAERERQALQLRARLSPPLTNVEVLDDEQGTTAWLAGSFEVVFAELIGVEAGGSWLHTESFDDPAWDVFARVNGHLPLYDARSPLDGLGWSFEGVGSVGYRFLHEVEELGELSGSLDLHALTVGAGGAALWWFEPQMALELRLLPTFSITLAESPGGAWGQSGGGTTVVQAPGVPSDQATQPGVVATSRSVGNSDRTDWGLDLEMTIGIVF